MTDDGRLFTFGQNDFGQLGVIDQKGRIPKQKNPVEVKYFAEKGIKLKQVVCGKSHTIALDTEGRVYSWGKGKAKFNLLNRLFYPQALALGHKRPANHNIPKQIEKLKGVKVQQISTGHDFALALAADGEVYGWGRGEFGTLGNSNKPQQEPEANLVLRQFSKESGSKIVKIESCNDFSSVLFDNGKLFSFGNNDQGNLGIGNSQSVDSCDSISDPVEMVTDPEEVCGRLLFKDLSLAQTISAFLSRDNKVYYAGARRIYTPTLFQLDYSKYEVDQFCATEKGIAVLTKCQKIFHQGNFLEGKKSSSKD